jgi:hypothetical protein
MRNVPPCFALLRVFDGWHDANNNAAMAIAGTNDFIAINFNQQFVKKN